MYDDVDDDDEEKIMMRIIQPLRDFNCGQVLSLAPGSVILYEKCVAKMLAGEGIAQILKLADFDQI